MDNQLRQFAAALDEALQDRGLDPSSPFTVAEIYQDFVPYRTHRDALGVEMNGDYEHLLLRLLSGEGEVLELQSNAALNQILTELDSPNPNTTLYRDFAALDVKFLAVGSGRPASPVVSESEAPAAEAEGVDFFGGAPDPDPVEEEASSAEVDPDEPMEIEIDDTLEVEVAPMAEAPESRPTPEAPATSGDSDETPCNWCRQVLPDRPNLNFCPFCGTDIRIVPCGSCGEALEPGWRFCVACGTEVAAEA